MKRAALLCVACLLAILAVTGTALAQNTQEDYDFIFIVNHGHRIEETDDRARVRFDCLCALAEDDCQTGTRAALIGIPVDAEEPVTAFELENQEDMDAFCEALNALNKKYYDSWTVALDALIQAKALTESGSDGARVVLVHSGTIDLSDERAQEANLAEWIDSLGDRFIAIQTRPEDENVFTGAELPNLITFNLNTPSENMLRALAGDDIFGVIQSLTAQSTTLPSSIEEKADEVDDEASVTGMMWTFELKAGGAERLLVLARADKVPETLWISSKNGETASVQSEYTQLGSNLLIDCRFDTPLNAGEWMLIAPDGTLGESVFLAPCWNTLSTELSMASELTCGERLEGSVSLKAGDTALNAADILAELGLSIKLDVSGQIVGEELENVHYSCPLELDADGHWKYDMTLKSGTYTAQLRLYDAQKREWTQCASEEMTITAENAVPMVVKDIQTEYELRYNDGEDDCDETWNLTELFEDTEGDTLYYTVEGDLESEIFNVVCQESKLSVSLSKQEEGECRLTLTAADQAAATAQTELVIRSIDYLRLQRETAFELVVEKTEKKDAVVTVTMTPVFPEEMDAAFAEAMLERISPTLTVNGKAIAFKKTEKGWSYEFTTDMAAQKYVIEVSVLLDTFGYGADEAEEAQENLTVEPDTVLFETRNNAPYTTVEDSEYKLTVEPFLGKKDYVAGAFIDPLSWFYDEDGDIQSVMAAVEGASLSLNGNQLRIDPNGTSGETIEISGDIALAAIRAGYYDVVFTATDVDGESAQVTVHVKAKSQTVMAWMIITAIAVLAAAVGVLLLIRYQRKPSFKTMKGAWYGRIRIMKVSVFGTQRDGEVDLSSYGKNAVTLWELVNKSGLIRVRGLETAILKSVALIPDHHGVCVRSRLSEDYSLSAGDKFIGGEEEKLESGTTLVLKKGEVRLLDVRLEQRSTKN